MTIYKHFCNNLEINLLVTGWPIYFAKRRNLVYMISCMVSAPSQ